MPENITVTIKEGTKGIAAAAFYYCYGITGIEIPNSVTSIGYSAFKECYNLRTIEIPNSVKSIGYEAFDLCRNLTRIDFKGTKAQWNNISKGYDWNSNTGNYTVYCTDGTIEK